MGEFRDNGYFAEFEIDQPVKKVWQMLQLRNDRQPAWLTAWPCLPGFQTTGEITNMEAESLITVHKHSEPCMDSEISVALVPAGNGTQVTVRQYKLPEWVKTAVPLFVLGGDQITADFILFLETGVEVSRHSMPWAFSGFTADECGSGLILTGVMPGLFGERLGLQSGDRLVTFGSAPVFTQWCVQALLRVLKSGDEVESTWIRDGKLLKGTATL
ncbi:MAG: hypothetical protein ABGY96_02710 [bacterium]|nr:hypothetical protein [Gammaproteobacteria bacterium]HIL95712.1 hypothetical protein [Pseudomonadales bacterium]